jgi:methyl-accepting chemotaxis protein
MRWLDNLKVANKVLLVVGLLAVTLLGVILFATDSLMRADDSYSAMVDKRDPALVRTAQAGRMIAEMGYGAYSSILHPGASKQAHDAAETARQAIKSANVKLDEAKALVPEDSQTLDGFKAQLARIEPLVNVAVDEGLKDDNAAATKAVDQVDPMIAALVQDITTFNAARLKDNSARSEALSAAASRSRMTIWAAGLVGLLFAGGLGIWIGARKIGAPLKDLASRMEKLAAGDLTIDVQGQDRHDEVGLMAKSVQVFKDNGLEMRRMEAEAEEAKARAEEERKAAQEAAIKQEQGLVVGVFGAAMEKLATGDLTFRVNDDLPPAYEKLRGDFNGAMGKLEETMTVIVSGGGNIHSSSQEITSASDDLAKRTQQQAASLEETAAALDQITATVRKTAQGATEAREVVISTKKGAEAGGQVVAEARTAMGEIETSAQKINQIIGVIDEIAFQTNLLALNAGVEAARAGDAGKGFAVVASEVRALAQRSADAAKEIKALISDSTARVSEGVRLVGDTGAALERIVTEVAQINALVTEIAQAAQEQATGLGQVNTAVNQMDQVTQQNAAMVEESTAASHALAKEANGLSDLMAQFRLSARPAPTRAPAGNPVHAAQARVAQMISTDQAKADANVDQWAEF